MAKPHRTADLPRNARRLLRAIVKQCLKARGLPTDKQSVAAAIELIEAGFVILRYDGASYWLEAVDGT